MTLNMIQAAAERPEDNPDLIPKPMPPDGKTKSLDAELLKELEKKP
jgi:hypothetical protein